MATVWKKDRPVSLFVYCVGGHWRCHAAPIGHSIKLMSGIRREDNYIVFVPGAAAWLDNVAERLNRATGYRNLLQGTLREECDEATVRGPKRLSGTICPGQCFLTKRIERTDPKQLLSVPATGHKRETPSIGCDRHRSGNRNVSQR